MPRAPWAAWPGGDGQFSARDWDLQVPHSPRGALPEVPTHSGPAAGSDQGVHSHSPMAQLPLFPLCFTAPWPCSGAERWDSRSCHRAGTHTLPLHPPQAPLGSCCCSLALAASPWDRLCLGPSLLASHFMPGLFK